MKIIKVNLLQDFSDAIREAVAVLKSGGTVVYPTDTVYGIGCNATDYKAVETIYRIKDRSLEKPLSVIARNMAWVKELAAVPTKLEPLLEKLWPGAITIILPKKSIIPNIVTSDKPNVGLRIPDYELTEKLMAKFGYPLISTSANMSSSSAEASDDKEAGNSRWVIETFKPRMWQPDLMLDAGELPPSAPSTIIDFSSVKPRILRIGPVKPKQLETILGIKFQ
ncbi:MAG: L-threonylcarbamoyladenylate synthase [Patescibacteria group bacterium]